MSDIHLVTGGAGFIGSHLAEALTARGARVRIFDNFSTGSKDNFDRFESAPEIVEGDLTDAKAVEEAVRGCRFVYHLGALASVARSVESPLVSHAACCTGTVHVLDAARRHNVKRVVYAASSSMYGGEVDPLGQREDMLPVTLSPYAAAKMAGELYMQAFASTYGLETVRVRFFNIFGPRQRADSPYSGVIAIFTGLISRGEAPQIHGDGLQSRDFTYVGNAVQALVRAMATPGISGRVYNVGTGSTITVLDLVASLNRIFGTSIEPKHVASRVGDVKFSRADISRIRADLGYDPTVDFEDGLRKTVEWYRSLDCA